MKRNRRNTLLHLTNKSKSFCIFFEIRTGSLKHNMQSRHSRGSIVSHFIGLTRRTGKKYQLSVAVKFLASALTCQIAIMFIEETQ